MKKCLQCSNTLFPFLILVHPKTSMTSKNRIINPFVNLLLLKLQGVTRGPQKRDSWTWIECGGFE